MRRDLSDPSLGGNAVLSIFFRFEDTQSSSSQYSSSDEKGTSLASSSLDLSIGERPQAESVESLSSAADIKPRARRRALFFSIFRARDCSYSDRDVFSANSDASVLGLDIGGIERCVEATADGLSLCPTWTFTKGAQPVAIGKLQNCNFGLLSVEKQKDYRQL
jgi:hypothetical protein